MSRKGAHFKIVKTAKRFGLRFKREDANEAFADYAARAREILADATVAAIPYQDRTDSFLAVSCIAHDISADGSRDAMISRLELHDKGSTVKTVALCTTISAPPPTDTYSSHLAPPVYARGHMLLLGIPHDIVKRTMWRIPRVEDLFSLLFTCRYLNEDAKHVLIARAQLLWNMAGASPLALSAKCYYEKRHRTSFAITYDMHIRGFVIGEDSGNPHNIIRNTIMAHGSVEAAMADCKRQKELEIATVAEKRRIIDARRERMRICTEALEALGYPPLCENSPIGVKTTSIGKVFQKISTLCAKTLDQIRRYISHGTTLSMADLEAKLIACAAKPGVLRAILPFIELHSSRRFTRCFGTISMLCNAFHSLPGERAFDTFSLEDALSSDYISNLVNFVVWQDDLKTPIALDYRFNVSTLKHAMTHVHSPAVRIQVYGTMGTIFNIAMDDEAALAERITRYEFMGCVFIRCHTR